MATERQEIFVRAFVNTGDSTRAAIDAGYGGDPSEVQWRLLRTPTVVAMISAELARARVEDGILARNALREIAQGSSFPAAARVTAARTLFEYVGLLGSRGETGAAKDPSEMSADELRDLIARLDKELGDRAKPVNAPVPALPDSQVSEFL